MSDLSVWSDIVNEVGDPRFRGLIHGQHSAYSQGCKGILCRKYNRDKARAAYARSNPTAKRARRPRNQELEMLLAKVIAQHARDVMHERAAILQKKILETAG